MWQGWGALWEALKDVDREISGQNRKLQKLRREHELISSLPFPRWLLIDTMYANFINLRYQDPSAR